MLHRLVYFAVPSSILHYFWLERDIKDWILVYIVLLTVLLAMRFPALRQMITNIRQRPQMIASETKPEVDS